MEGDPAVRWQAQRDLLKQPPRVWQAERARTLEKGWIRDLLDRQSSPGQWPEGRWIGMPWVMLVLLDLGIPNDCPEAPLAAQKFLDQMMPPGKIEKQIAR